MSKVLTLWPILFGSIFGEPGMYQTRSELSEMSCLAEWPNLIIRTTESIRNGAVFLDSVDNANSAVRNFKKSPNFYALSRQICNRMQFKENSI